jgi:hypothetical protein
MLKDIAWKSMSPRAVLWGLGLALSVVAAAAYGDDFDPFQDVTSTKAPVASVDPFDELMSTVDGNAKPAATVPAVAGRVIRTTQLQLQPEPPPRTDSPDSATSEMLPMPTTCGVPNEKPLSQLSIDIRAPQGQLPTDHAASCWEQLNSSSGPSADMRFWAEQCYNWNASCMFHRPLYFEEINLERYGYGCCECLQPFASAAHFFGTVPVLPYCMAADCPGECEYTLGHYRPGSCPPWHCHRPPYRPIAGLSQAGVLTGLIFLIP